MLPFLSPAPTPVSSFVNNGTVQTVAALLSSFPASASVVGKYARVSDLYGSVDEVMRCRWDGVAYRWIPQRVLDFAKGVSQTSGTLTVTPLISAPVLILRATLLGNMTVNLSTTNAWIGQAQRIRSPALLGLNSLTLGNLLGGVTKTLLGGGDTVAVYTEEGWDA